MRETHFENDNIMKYACYFLSIQQILLSCKPPHQCKHASSKVSEKGRDVSTNCCSNADWVTSLHHHTSQHHFPDTAIIVTKNYQQDSSGSNIICKNTSKQWQKVFYLNNFFSFYKSRNLIRNNNMLRKCRWTELVHFFVVAILIERRTNNTGGGKQLVQLWYKLYLKSES